MALQVEGGCPGSWSSPGPGRAGGQSCMSQAQGNTGQGRFCLQAGRSNAQHISGVCAAPTLPHEGGGSAPASVLETIHLGPLVLLVFHSPIS